MYVDAIDSDSYDLQSLKFHAQEGCLNGTSVYVLDGKNAIGSLPLETRLREGFSLADRKDGIKPKMSRVTEFSLELKHTQPDGSSISGTVTVKRDPEKDTDNSSSSDNDNNKDYEIDSHDRDYERDDG